MSGPTLDSTNEKPRVWSGIIIFRTAETEEISGITGEDGPKAVLIFNRIHVPPHIRSGLYISVKQMHKTWGKTTFQIRFILQKWAQKVVNRALVLHTLSFAYTHNNRVFISS